MRSSLAKKACLLSAFSLIIAIPGCVIPNQELLQMRSDMNELKKENARLQETKGNLSPEIEDRLLSFEEELASLKSRFIKTGADSNAILDSIKSDFQRIAGSFEETRYLVEKTSGENRASLEGAEMRIKAIDDRVATLEKKIMDIAGELETIKLNISPLNKEKIPGDTGASPNELYKEGLASIRGGNTKEAREKFKYYIKGYPDGPLANNAQFWIGESYYDEKDYERAIIEYDDVVKRYPGGIKVPAAMLKQAMAFENLKDAKTAQALYKKLIETYPDSEEAKAAKKKIKK